MYERGLVRLGTISIYEIAKDMTSMTIIWHYLILQLLGKHHISDI
jgi:hypothetical protein